MSSSVIVSEELALDDISQRASIDEQHLDEVYSDTFESESDDSISITEEHQVDYNLPREDDDTPSQNKPTRFYDKFGSLQRSPYSDEEETPLTETPPDMMRYNGIAGSVRLSNYLVSPQPNLPMSHSTNPPSAETTGIARVPYSDEEDSSGLDSPTYPREGRGGDTGADYHSTNPRDHEDIVTYTSAGHTLGGGVTGGYSLADDIDASKRSPSHLDYTMDGMTISDHRTTNRTIAPCTPIITQASLPVSVNQSISTECTSRASPLSAERQWNAMIYGEVGSLTTFVPHSSPMSDTRTQTWTQIGTQGGQSGQDYPPPLPRTNMDNDDVNSIHSAGPSYVQPSTPYFDAPEGLSRSVSEPSFHVANPSPSHPSLSLPRPSHASPSPSSSVATSTLRAVSPYTASSPAIPRVPLSAPTTTHDQYLRRISNSRGGTGCAGGGGGLPLPTESSSDSNELDTPPQRPPRSRAQSAGDGVTPPMQFPPSPLPLDISPAVALFPSPAGKSPHYTPTSALHRAALVKAAQSSTPSMRFSTPGPSSSAGSPLASQYSTPPSSTRHGHGPFFAHTESPRQGSSPLGGALSVTEDGMCTAGSGDTSPTVVPYPWVEYVSEDGWPYFYNEETGESSWERPGSGGYGGGVEEVYGASGVNVEEGGEVEWGHTLADYSMEDGGQPGEGGHHAVPADDDGGYVPGEYVDDGWSSGHDESQQEAAVAGYAQSESIEPTWTGPGEFGDDNDSQLSPCTSSDEGGNHAEDVVSVKSTLSLSRSSVFDMKNKSGQSALHISASSANADALELLVS